MTTSRPVGNHSPEVRRLHIQLATLLAGIADLWTEWDATLELGEYLRAQRVRAGRPATTLAVSADLEAILRASTALPTVAYRLTTERELLPAVKKAQKIYDDLIAQHIAQPITWTGIGPSRLTGC